MSLKKWLYVAEILLEVAKTLLPFVKAYPISIDRTERGKDDNEANME